MKTDVVTFDYATGQHIIKEDIIRSLVKNGSYLPAVRRVVFNLKTVEKVQVKNDDGSNKYVEAKDRDGKVISHKDGTPVMKVVYETKRVDHPILVTKVWWDDNTTTTVSNSASDKVETEMKKLSNGESVEVATEASKTFGLMAAVVKRTCGYPDENGEIVETNMGKILSDIVKSGYDQNFEAAKAKLQKSEAKAKYKEQSNKPKQKRYSYADLAQLLGPILEKISDNPDLLNKLVEKVSTGA